LVRPSSRFRPGGDYAQRCRRVKLGRHAQRWDGGRPGWECWREIVRSLQSDDGRRFRWRFALRVRRDGIVLRIASAVV
jgi:hypothetical protein